MAFSEVRGVYGCDRDSNELPGLSSATRERRYSLLASIAKALGADVLSVSASYAADCHQ